MSELFLSYQQQNAVCACVRFKHVILYFNVRLYWDSQGGMYVFQLFDYYACNGACVLFLSLFESLAMGWTFGE